MTRRRRSPWLAIGVGLAAAALAWGLWRLSSGRTLTGEDWAWAGSRVLLVVLIVCGALARGFHAPTAVRHGLIWLGIVAVLVLGFSFRDEAGFVFARVRSELAPAVGVATGPGELTVSREADGHFYVMGEVDKVPVRFLIDTGASDIVLSPEDARRIGVNLAALDFSRVYGTANGAGRGAAWTAPSLSIGSLSRTEVPMAVNGAPMGASLLGMSFFRGLESVEMRGNRLRLRWTG